MLQPTLSSVSSNDAACELSLREYYAGIALASLMTASGSADASRAKTNIWKPEHIADKAVQLADAMVQRLART